MPRPARRPPSSSTSARRPTITTAAPQRTSSAAAALPRFVPPPVTSATWPSSAPGGEDPRALQRYSPSTLITSRFGPAAVELAVEDLLPGPEVEPPVGDRDDHLVVDEQILEVGVAVVLAAAVVAVVAGVGQQLAGHVVGRLLPARRRDLVEPLERVGLQPGLVVVDPHAGGDVHRADQRHPLGDARLADGVGHVLGDPDELPPAGGVEGAVDGVRRSRGAAARHAEAGEPGFEPGFTVLETARIAINSLPYAASDGTGPAAASPLSGGVARNGTRSPVRRHGSVVGER